MIPQTPDYPIGNADDSGEDSDERHLLDLQEQ